MTTQNPLPGTPKQIVSEELFYVDGKPYIFSTPSYTTQETNMHGHVVHCVEHI